jgi:hypothetical protein
MPQTSMIADPLTGRNGSWAYPNRPGIVDSKVVNMSGGIPFGVFVARDSDNKAKLPAAAGAVTTTGIGISFCDLTKEYDSTGYATGDEIPVVRKGYVLCQVEDAVTEEGAVFARITASGGNTQLGKLRSDADSGNATAVPNARFRSTASAGGLAVVEVW